MERSQGIQEEIACVEEVLTAKDVVVHVVEKQAEAVALDSGGKEGTLGMEAQEEVIQEHSINKPVEAGAQIDAVQQDSNKNKGEVVEAQEDDDVIVIPPSNDSNPSSRRSPELRNEEAPVAKDDELLLTLGGSWGAGAPQGGAKKPSSPVEEAQLAKNQSLSAPDTSLSLGSAGGGLFAAAGKAVRSVSNTTTNNRSHYSNDCTTTISQPSNTKSFVHNPSCSLTHTSFDELNSSASQYVNDGNDSVSNGKLLSQVSDLQKHKNASFEQHTQHQGSVTSLSQNNDENNNNSQQQPPAKWNSYNLEKYHALFPDLKEGFRARFAGTRRGKHNKESGKLLPGEHRIGLYEIASDPVAVVAHKLQELPDIFLEDLKKSLTEMLGSVEKRDEFLRLQRILQRRTDLSAETLFLAHRAQLELLVALKTGIQAFLLRDNPLSTSALVEIFLQKRCRNFACQNQLPADDCDCQFCSQKEGFCNACMCIACSKFDFMANTCRWVGCDFCLHWCHTDCGIRLSFIKPGAVQGKPGQFEMQFQCVACGHASDLFGFVKEVFTNYAKEWSPEILRKELDCIQRIFRRSQDMRGKQLCWIGEQVLGKIEGCTDTAEICETLLRFFSEGKVDLDKANANQKAPAPPPKETTRAAEGVLPRTGFTSTSEEMRNKANMDLQMLDRELEAKRNEIAKMQYSRARKRTEIEEMESLIHMKQAEAKMFQLRADEARLEAEGLKKIVLAKNEKIEEEYVLKGLRLHLNDAVEKRKRSFLEYQMLEQGVQDFNSMKSKLVTDVHDVLRKMDTVVNKRSRML